MKQFYAQRAEMLEQEIANQNTNKYAVTSKIQGIAKALWPDYSDSEIDCIIEAMIAGSSENVQNATSISAAFIKDMEASRNILDSDQTNLELSNRFKDGLTTVNGSSTVGKVGLNQYAIEFDDGFKVVFEPIVRDDGTPGLLVIGSKGPSVWN